MTPIPEQSLRVLSALAAYWRGDWSDFDGRTLRAQLDDIASLIRRECGGEDVFDAAQAYINGLEPVVR